jgi:hypothetical protein
VALSSALECLFGDPALRLRLGAAAREAVEQRFSLDVCVRRHLGASRRTLRGRDQKAVGAAEGASARISALPGARALRRLLSRTIRSVSYV